MKIMFDAKSIAWTNKEKGDAFVFIKVGDEWVLGTSQLDSKGKPIVSTYKQEKGFVDATVKERLPKKYKAITYFPDEGLVQIVS